MKCPVVTGALDNYLGLQGSAIPLGDSLPCNPKLGRSDVVKRDQLIGRYQHCRCATNFILKVHAWSNVLNSRRPLL
jgi:hypothetical protein